MHSLLRIAILVLVSFSPPLFLARYISAADAPEKLTLVRMGLAARSTTTMPFFVARERGFFREEGLEVELIVMQAIQTIQATLGNSTQFASATGSAVSAAVQGADIKVVFAVTDRPSFDLISQPNITSVQQLRGKKIGTGGVGSLAEILARRILIANNVRPEEVSILATGPSHVTYLSLKAKVIDAAPLQMPLTFTAQDEGFRKLAAAGDVYQSVQGGLATTKLMLTEHPDLVAKVVRAMLRATRLIKSDRKYAIEFLKGPWVDLGKNPEKIAARVYDVAGPDFLENGSVSEEIQRQMIADASLRIKPKQTVLPEQAFDFSIVRKIGATLK
ncbi:MAG TPA: ABC transporter substrate-binding protein [Candidatus Binatia bacterium]|jgi:ABC-type nitrate/sulfonate/bicarbonate transport system substrate-binding protein|nr:ABC transporter substrate-binding protein [Candidatus Binatia bacterium]